MRALLMVLAAAAPPAAPPDFWTHWGDGRAELCGYRLTQPRYGALRTGVAVLVFVTEDFSDTLRVKADPGKHPPKDVYPVMKLNAIRRFQTGIYDYHVMTSVFARPVPGWPLAKVSFSSQEWCGHVYQQLLWRDGRIESERHSYFDGEADAREVIDWKSDGVLEDALPITLRDWGFSSSLRGSTSMAVPFLRSLLRARLEHRRLEWGRATLTRSGEPRR